jgi:hypothetical protein
MFATLSETQITIGGTMSNETQQNNNGKKDFEPLAPGDYMVRLDRYNEVPTKNGKGVLGKASFQVISDEKGVKNRLIFQNFLVEHTSQKAQEIGTKQLDEYLMAVGAGGLEGIGYDRSEIPTKWNQLPFIATVGVEEPSEYTAADGTTKMSKARNVIKKFTAR